MKGFTLATLAVLLGASSILAITPNANAESHGGHNNNGHNNNGNHNSQHDGHYNRTPHESRYGYRQHSHYYNHSHEWDYGTCGGLLRQEIGLCYR